MTTEEQQSSIGAIGGGSGRDRRWLALGLVCLAQFLVVLDVAIVTTALPTIKRSLDFSPTGLQWVLSAYTLTFGGLLLLGGRVSDLLGRRRVFMTGLVVFCAASLACGLASSSGMLIASRAVEGVGAAIISPAALSIVTTTFTEGAERNKALGIFWAIGGAGAAVGVLAGGLLTSGLGWGWIFFVNLPVGLTALAFCRAVIAESHANLGHRRFDTAGAVTATAGLSLLVYAVVSTDTHGWGSATTIGLLAGAAALLMLFVAIEARSSAPLMPLGFFRNRTVSAANLVGLTLGTSVFAMFFFLSLYMQQVMHYSPTKAGLAFLIIALVQIPAAGIAQSLVTKISIKTVLAAGMALFAVAQLLFAQVPVNGGLVGDLLPGYVIVGVALGFAFVPVGIAALVGVRPHDAGLASGLINTSQQIGGALGIAITSTVAASHTAHLLTSGHSAPGALTSGFHYAFIITAGFAAAGALLTLVVIRRADVAEVHAVAATETA